ncbi:dihydrofolate reductase-like domain-containing protein [Microdochium bolleyi]|uniref:Dihydrofolate reductase n=1 Tax=Microdochium bolleyi TaxID=196109 RepID=A0A136JBA1_9PEZI|nr:dihydrofolate reductase-like domain-containing protein [Microdochium bolleyi]
MPPSPPLELTLVVAATRQMGIGRNGTLPWTGLRKEMAYFARVTKRLPASADPSTAQNVVIMGRKTWDSIPEKFRPLKDRLNIVISRSHPSTASSADAVVKLDSLESVLHHLRARQGGNGSGKVFVIGGGEIYAAALKLEEARRVLLTSVLEPEFECDTQFPLALGGDKDSAEGWEQRSKDALDAWTGEEVPGGVQEENGTRYEFQMWERQP